MKELLYDCPHAPGAAGKYRLLEVRNGCDFFHQDSGSL